MTTFRPRNRVHSDLTASCRSIPSPPNPQRGHLSLSMPQARLAYATSLLCAVFFVSGASALIFETLWFHQASLAFGSSVWASSLVLSGFMAGLALGSVSAVWKRDRLGPPIRTYAVLEAVIAVSGVALVYFLPSLGALTSTAAPARHRAPVGPEPGRLLLAFVVLLIPSTAMGLTLPLLTEALVAADPNFGRALGRLYGWNTLGAVLGAVVAETHLVGALGIHGSGLAAGSLNLLAALSAGFIYRSLHTQVTSTAAESTTAFRLSGRCVARRRVSVRLCTTGAGSGVVSLPSPLRDRLDPLIRHHVGGRAGGNRAGRAGWIRLVTATTRRFSGTLSSYRWLPASCARSPTRLFRGSSHRSATRRSPASSPC